MTAHFHWLASPSPSDLALIQPYLSPGIILHPFSPELTNAKAVVLSHPSPHDHRRIGLLSPPLSSPITLTALVTTSEWISEYFEFMTPSLQQSYLSTSTDKIDFVALKAYVQDQCERKLVINQWDATDMGFEWFWEKEGEADENMVGIIQGVRTTLQGAEELWRVCTVKDSYDTILSAYMNAQEQGNGVFDKF